jgi:hypothetical protein
VLQQLQTLKQDDDTVEDFYKRFTPLWCKLHSLVPLPDVCRGCACCVKRQQHNDKSCLYEFLIQLRPEFEPAKVRLLSSSPLPSVIEARNTLLVEEILLQRTAPVVTPAEKKTNNKKKKHSGSCPNLRSSEPSEGSSSPLSQDEVARMVNWFQGLTHQGSSGSTNLPHSRYSTSRVLCSYYLPDISLNKVLRVLTLGPVLLHMTAVKIISSYTSLMDAIFYPLLLQCPCHLPLPLPPVSDGLGVRTPCGSCR